MDPGGAGLLGEADDRVLYLRRSDHHQVGEFVDDAEDVWKGRLSGALARAVELGQVAAARLSHDPVAALHLADQVGEHVRCQPR